MKVDTTVLVARYTALAVTIGFILVDVVGWSFLKTDISITITLIKAIIVAAITYSIVYYFMGRFLVERLSVIYKLIRNNRLNTPISFDGKSPDEMLQKTEIDVKEWGIKRLSNLEKEEILKKYRQDFIGNISHELKTPLFSVEGYIHTLLDGAMNDPSLTKKYLSKAADNVDRLSEIIEAMTTVSQFESGQLELDIKAFDIRELVVECEEELRYLLEDKKATVNIAGDEYTKVLVFGDRGYIRQVLINLMSNSIRYGKSKGVTKIDFSVIGNQYLIEVIDEGDGIEAEHLPHLFDRFYRVDSGRSRKEGGSGIGLAIVKHIMNAHGQRVQVASELGKGSNFSFTLRKA